MSSELIAALLLLLALNAEATPRSRVARSEFQRSHPCPATHAKRGACPGFVVDHVIPLCAGGPDVQSNMQWQTVADGKVKDREERKMCRRH